MTKNRDPKDLIPIDENAGMLVEDNNYTLYRRAGSAWRVDGYFPTIDTLMRDWVVNAPAHAKTPPKSLQEVVDIIRQAEETIKRLVKGK